MSVQPNIPQQRRLPIQADALQSLQPRQYPVRVAIAEQWTGQPIARQTSAGTLTFVGWADPEKHYEVWQDQSGKQYVRNVGGTWYRGEDIAKAQAESQKTLQQLNVVETQYNPQLNSTVHRYFEENGKWYTFDYDPNTNSYTKVEVPSEKLQQDIFDKILGVSSVNVSGYNIPGIDKIAEREPHAFTWYGPEYAWSYARLRETFPELRNEKWITGADVQKVVSARLEKYDWRPDTADKYELLQELSYRVLDNPDVWKDVQADLDRQLAEAEKRIEELQRFYEVKAFKEWEAESETKTNEYMNRLYNNQEHPFQVFTEQTGSSFLQQISFGLLGGPSQFQQKLYGALGVLGSKANINENVFRAGIQVVRGISPASFFGTDLLGLDLSNAIKATLGLGNIAAGKASLSTGEKAYLKAVSQDFTNENLAAYMAGSALGSGLAMYLQGKAIESVPEVVRFTKWEFTSNEALAGKILRDAGIELKTPKFISNISETLKAKALNVGEKIGLVEKVDYVPTKAEVDVAIVKEGGEERAIFKTSLGDFKPAREVLGVERVPLEYRVSGSDISLFKLKTSENPVFKPVFGEQTAQGARGFNAGLDAFLKLSGEEPRLPPEYSPLAGNWKFYKEIRYIGEESVLGGPATYRSFDTGLDAFLKVTKGETRLPPDYLLDFDKWITEGKAPFANEPFYYRVPQERYVFSSPAEKAEFMKYRGAFAYGSPLENKSIIAVGKPLETFEPGFTARTGRYGGQIDYSELIEKLGGYKPPVPETFDFGKIVSKAKKGVYEFNYFWKITFPEKVMDVFGNIGDKLKNIIGLGKETKEVPEWTPIKIESDVPTQFALPQTTGFKPVAGRAGLVEIVEESEQPAGQVKTIIEPELKIPVITKTELAPQVRTAVEFARVVGPRLPSLYGLTNRFPAGAESINVPTVSVSMTKPFQDLKPPSLDTFIQSRIRADIFAGQAPRLDEITMPRLEPWLDTKIEPKLETKIGEIAIPKVTPKIEVPPISIPDYRPPPEETRPKLPGLPLPVSSGTRDVPIPGPRLYGRKEWVVDWFGPGAYFPAIKSKSRKSKSGRGGRRK